MFVHKAMGLVDEPFGVPSSHPSIFRTRFFQKPGSRKEVGLSSKQQQKQETLLVTQKKPVPSTRLKICLYIIKTQKLYGLWVRS